MIDLMESEDATYGRMFSILGGTECLFWSFFFFFFEKLHVCLLLLLLLLFFCMIHLLKSDPTKHPYFRLYCYPDEDIYTASKLSVTSTRNSFLKSG